jgi:hypothetical protein
MPTPPQIVTLPAASDHYGGPWDRLLGIALHHTGGTDSRAWLTRTSDPPVSVQTLIRKDGIIYRIVPLGQQAWHVGFSALGRYHRESPVGSCNEVLFGIELENLGDGQDPYPDVQILACGYEIAHVWRAGGVVPILTHAIVDTGGKTDPRGLDLARVFRAALLWYDNPAGPPPPRRYTADSPLLAAPSAKLADVAARFPAPAGDYTVSDVHRSILPVYWKLCTEMGLDPVIVIAQLAHETDWLTSFWAQRPQRNPAGIGVTGDWRPLSDPQPYPPELWRINTDRKRWEYGLSFATWAGDSIPAHIGRLLAYALPAGEGTLEQQLLITRALGIRPLPGNYRGVAPTLRGLNGRWAAGQGYADALASVANRLTGV